MPSPFPGMDPHIEMQEWEDFHLAFNLEIRNALSRALRPDYAVRVEKRIYIESVPGAETQFVADVAVMGRGEPATTSSASAETLAAVECLLPDFERREAFLVVRESRSGEVITVIETLSPSNKRPGARGFQEYAAKRETLIHSASNFVEVDLLRGGQPPAINGRPPGDYFVTVSRAEKRPRVSVYAWGIRQPLPKVPIPLRSVEEFVEVDLQVVFERVFDGAHYERTLDRDRAIEPPLSEADAEWMQALW